MKRKILAVCIGGTVRSVAIKDVLNGTGKWDGLAASAISQTPETMKMLCDWAEVIVPVENKDLIHGTCSYPHQEKWAACVMWNPEYDNKRHVIDIGPDVWANARHPALSEIVRSRVRELS